MKKWFARFVLFSGLYDIILAVVFLFASPLVSLLLNYPISILSGALLQIIGAFLLAFGIALISASRTLEQYLIIPIANIPARIIAFIVLAYYVLLGLPPALLLLATVDGLIGIVLILFIIAIPDYSFRSAFKTSST
jgi:hypothetical protein